MINPCQEIAICTPREILPIMNSSPPPGADVEKWLMWKVINLENKLHKEELARKTLEEVLDNLRHAGVIDQWNRPLPLKDHHQMCPHGKDGKSLCTCDIWKLATSFDYNHFIIHHNHETRMSQTEVSCPNCRERVFIKYPFSSTKKLYEQATYQAASEHYSKCIGISKDISNAVF